MLTLNKNKVVVSNKNDNLNTGLQLPLVHNSLSISIRSTLMSSLEGSSWFEKRLSSTSGAYDDSFSLGFSITSNCSTSKIAA